MLSILCGKVGVLQRKAAFAKSATVSVAVQNVGGKLPPHRESEQYRY